MGNVPKGTGKGPGYNAEILPPFSTKPPVAFGPTAPATDDLSRRLVGSNPFDAFYLTLPSKLTPQQVMNILRSAQGGDVWQLAQAYDLALTQWAMLKKCTSELKEAVSSVKFDVHPYCVQGQEPTESAKEKADFVQRCFAGMKPNPANDERGFQATVYHLADIPFMGVGMQEIIWGDYESGPNGGLERRPRATTFVHPRHFTYTSDGFLTVFDENYSRYVFNPDNNAVYAPDPDRFLCGQYYSHLGSPLSSGIIRPLLIWMPMIVFGREWSLNFAQKHGAPFIDITYKAGMQPGEIDQLNNFAAKAASQGYIIHVEGTTVTVTAPHAQGSDNPIRVLMEEADRQCQLLILGQTLTTDMPKSGAGSYAASQTHAGIRSDKIESVAKWIAQGPLEQFARACLRVNYENEDECPSVVPDFAKTLEASEKSTLITSLGTCPLPFLAEEVYKLLGFSVPEEGDKVTANGKLGELGPTDDEISALGLPGVEEVDQQLELAEQQAKIAKKYATKPAPSKKTKASEMRAILAEASNQDVEELRSLVIAARSATHMNGELQAVQDKLKDIASKSRFKV